MTLSNDDGVLSGTIWLYLLDLLNQLDDLNIVVHVNIKKNMIVVLGPTASGKTRLGVQIAHVFGGEVISADSRQVYRGLNIGSGKDLEEYEVDGHRIPYHLIDIVDLDHEFNVFEYQKQFFDVFVKLRDRKILPVVVGGTGLYLESVLKGYRMVEVPENPELRARLSNMTLADLTGELSGLKSQIHNKSDLDDRDRLVRAIEIALHSRDHNPEPGPDINPIILGTHWPRDVLRERISIRLRERLDRGMVEEVEALHDQGVIWEKLHFLGLEYRFVAQYLQGKIKNRNDLYQKLAGAIAQFEKRQETWFRRMERNGTVINWVDHADIETAKEVVLQSIARDNSS